MLLLAALLLATSAASPHGAVATAHPLASEAGASILRRGGNAVDAAVAAAFALGVVRPASCGLGGGGFALVYLAREKKTYVLDFREVGPAKARPDMYVVDGKPRSDLSLDGPLAIAVPGAVKGYVELARRFGKKALSELTSPAELIAARGFPVTKQLSKMMQRRLDCLSADPDAAAIFTQKDPEQPGRRKPLQPGDRLVQKDLSRTLHLVGERGDAPFYTGRVARSMVATVEKGGGLLSLDDLKQFHTRELSPLEGTYRGWKVVTMPPPSSGGLIVLGLLNALEPEAPRGEHDSYRPERFLHVLIEAEKRLFARRERLGDPAFNPGVPALTAETISKEFAQALRAQIGERAAASKDLVLKPESPETSHVSVIDEEGNAVSLTTTINDSFGSCVVAKGTGVLLNDQMDDFAIAPGVPNTYGVRGGGENAPGPGKVPLSSMAPTLVFDPDGALRLSVGSPGGSTIPTTVAQAILHFIDDHMPVDRALAAPRLHHQLFPEYVRADDNGLDAATQLALEARGHVFKFTEGWGDAQAVSIDPNSGLREAASDPRGDGQGAVP
jgi:gamma-glutamyltranspeptidase / glutathione hydrolase